MANRKLRQPKTEDKLLPRAVTDEFVTELNELLADAPDVKSQYLLRYWLTKYCELDVGQARQRRSAAIEKWLKTEIRNSVTNTRLTSSAGRLWFSSTRTFDDVLNGAAKVIRDIIGSAPSLDLLHGGFSGGATTSRPRNEGHPALKFLGQADVTRPAYQIWTTINGSRWADHWNESGLEPRFVPGNVLFTVPKNAEIDRVAAKEPDLNIFLQKMLGNQLRWCLRRVGINLNDQSINGELARRGSIDGSLATLDLSSASDSVTYQLVKRLLPFDWFYYLEAFRSPVTEIDGDLHINEMFSSMGNGFTFELESLIFYSLARSTARLMGVRGKLSVYGDDIIVPTDLVEPFIRVLSFAGFQTNAEKSFYDGPFRESCGSYWHAGEDVKPFFLRGPLHRLSDLIHLLNSLASWATFEGIVDPRFEELWLKFRVYVPKVLWGGQDFTSRSSLVTADLPRKELKEVTRLVSHTHVGGLLFWLFAAYGRLGFVDDPLSTAGSLRTGLSRLRRNRQLLNTDLPLFLHRSSSCVNAEDPACTGGVRV